MLVQWKPWEQKPVHSISKGNYFISHDIIQESPPGICLWEQCYSKLFFLLLFCPWAATFAVKRAVISCMSAWSIQSELPQRMATVKTSVFSCPFIWYLNTSAFSIRQPPFTKILKNPVAPPSFLPLFHSPSISPSDQSTLGVIWQITQLIFSFSLII